MGYLVIENFRLGLDRRKSWLSAPPGSLWELENAHITPGGEIEGRLAFVPFPTLPDGTYGLQAVPGGLVVFGSIPTPAAFPISLGTVQINYVRCQHPTAREFQAEENNPAYAMSEVLCSEQFGGHPWCAARFANGQVFAYYAGSLIAQFRNGRVLQNTEILDLATEISAALHAAVPGLTVAPELDRVTIQAPAEETFEVTVSAASALGELAYVQTSEAKGDTQNKPAIEYLKLMSATGSAEVIGITVDGYEILGTPVALQELTPVQSLEAFAEAIAEQINAYASDPKYTAAASQINGIWTVTISGDPDLGASLNGLPVKIYTEGNIVVSTEDSAYPFEVTLNKSQVSGTKNSSKPQVVTTGEVECSANGGKKKYKFAWTTSEGIVAKSPSSRDTKFASKDSMLLDTRITGTAYCTVTDALGRVAVTNKVDIVLTLNRKGK